MKEPEKSALRFCLTHISDEFHLYCSPWKDSLQSIRHPLPSPYSPLPKVDKDEDEDVDEEEEEAFPADNDNNESYPDFLPDKK